MLGPPDPHRPVTVMLAVSAIATDALMANTPTVIARTAEVRFRMHALGAKAYFYAPWRWRRAVTCAWEATLTAQQGA